jgi:hypothetical protein
MHLLLRFCGYQHWCIQCVGCEKQVSFAQVASLLACGLLIWKQSRLQVSYVNTSSIPKDTTDFLTYATIPTNPPNNVPAPERHGIVVVVPGLGDPARLPQLKSTLLALQQSAEPRVDFACIVYVWKQALVENITQELDFCVVEFGTGYGRIT